MIWPDSTWATLSEVLHGEYTHMSDDYEIVDCANEGCLHELGIDTEDDDD